MLDAHFEGRSASERLVQSRKKLNDACYDFERSLTLFCKLENRLKTLHERLNLVQFSFDCHYCFIASS